MTAVRIKIPGMNNNYLHPNFILAVETSCDETAAAVVHDGYEVLSNVISSQVEVHREYGGVVPEIASRCHMEAIVSVVDKALEEAGCSLEQMDGLAVTQGPGLIGSLIVGLSFVKAISAASGIPATGINHVHAHLFSPFLASPTPPPFPFLGLAVSGGHTSLYLVRDYLSVELLGQTRDDAAGEAFDKVAKLLGLEYPGGPVISEMARHGNPNAFQLPRAWLRDSPCDFSFSGLKTAVLNLVHKISNEGPLPVADICASFQEAVVDVLVEKTIRAASERGIRHVVIAGGVSANQRLRVRALNAATASSITIHLPGSDYCTDNGAMAGLLGYHQIARGILLTPEADAYSRMP